MPWFGSLSRPKPKISRPVLFPVSLLSPFSSLFSSAAKRSQTQPNWFLRMQMWQGTSPDELRQRSLWKSEWKIGRCLRFSTGLQPVRVCGSHSKRFGFPPVRFGSWIWTVPVRFLWFRFVSRFAVRFQNHTDIVHPIRMNLNSGLMPTCGCDRLPSLRGSNARFLGIKSLWTYCCFTSLHQLVPHLVPNYPPCPSVMCRCVRVWNIWTDVTVRNTSS